MGTVLLAAAGGLAAGFITTVAGLGGGISLVALLSIVMDPKDVVGLTAPVLMVGNLSRFAMFRDELDRPAAGWVLAGALPTAVVGALLLPELPARAIQLGMGLLLLAFVVVQVVRGRGERPERPAPIDVRVGAPVGLVLGSLSATVGGAGPVTAPFWHARLLRKGAFAATNALTNGLVHAVKTAVFVATGLLALPHLGAAGAAAVTVTVGNRLGKTVLGRISEALFVRLLLVAITVAALRLLLG